MFAFRYARLIVRTYEFFNQTATISAKYTATHSHTKYKLLNTTIRRNTFCSTAGDSPEEYKPDIDAIAKGDPEMEKKLKVLLLEIEVLRQEGSLVPSAASMRQEDWEELVKLRTRSGRVKFLMFLFKKEKRKESQKIKQARKREEWEKIKQQQEEKTTEEEGIKYGLMYNNIFLRFYDTTINHFYNSRVIQAMQFGQKLVIDCSYEQHMTKQEIVNCAKQLMFVFADNRVHDDPYDLHYCNLNEGMLREYLKRQIPTMDEPWFPLNSHTCSYLDLFPKDQLVYLTPHCREVLDTYDHDAIYIVGGMVDKSIQQPLSLAKAKKENLRMAKFPLDKYLQWGSGSGKSLTLNHCLSILLDVKQTGDWKYAFRHVPKRKLMDFSMNSSLEDASNNLRYDKRLQKFRRMWKPSAGVELGNSGRSSFGLEDDEEEENERKPRVNLKNVLKYK